MTDDDEQDPDRDEPIGRMTKNSRIVSQACDRYFAAKGLRCYDLKGNLIDPLTKKQLPDSCKHISKD